MASTEIVVPAPPVLPEQEPVSTTLVSALPMLAGMGSMVMMAGMAGAGQSRTLVAGGFFLLSTSAFIGAQVSRQFRQRRRQITSQRVTFQRQITEVRAAVRAAALHQVIVLDKSFPTAHGWMVLPDADVLPVGRDDVHFGTIRIGVSDQLLDRSLVALPTEDPDRADPAAVRAADDLVRVHRHVPDLPCTVKLPDLDRIEITGPIWRQQAVARAMVISAVTKHAHQDVRVVLVCPPDELALWEWLKWLPHHRSSHQRDAAAGARLVLTPTGPVPPDDDVALTLVVTIGVDPTRDSPPMPNTTVLHLTHQEKESVRTPDRTRSIHLGPIQDPDAHDDVISTPSGPTHLRAEGCAMSIAEAVARRLDRLATDLATTTRSGRVAPTNDLPELLGIPDLTQWVASHTWQERRSIDTLVAPLGLDDQGAPVHLDLKESALGGSGPHGLVVGATGSGKSELLRTLVLALAMRHSPDELGMVLVDFKGGATFAGLADLPHVSALVTNLGDDHSLVNRMQDALTGELVRRQELLHASGHASLQDYQAARSRGEDLPAVPSLFVCIDEFSELLTARPEFIEVFVAIGRLGRSLGIHLLLASQRIDEGRLRGLESHLSYRIGLRTFSAAESRAAIGVPDAHTLPQKPGVGLMVTGTEGPRRFTTAYVSGPRSRPRAGSLGGMSTQTPVRLLPFTLLPLPASARAVDPDARNEQGVRASEPANRTTTVELVVRAVTGPGVSRTHAVWLPPLTTSPLLSSLMTDLITDPEHGLVSPTWRSAHGRRVPVGVIDRPKEQRRDVCTVDLSGATGHLVVVGGPRSGKSTLLATVVSAIALTSTPKECQFFLLDFAGGSMAPLAGLPHVAGTAVRGDEMVTRVMAEILDLVARRERYFRDHGISSWEDYVALRTAGAADDGYGEVHVVVDGWGTLRTDHFELESTLQQVAERALSFGVHLLVATPRWSDLRSSMRDLLGSRIELRLGDPVESVVDRRRASAVPSSQPGRGLVAGGYELLTARPVLTDDGDLEELVVAAADAWRGPTPTRLRRLPDHVALADLLASASTPPDGCVVLGLDGHDLSPVTLDPTLRRHLLVRGADRSGRTAALRAYVSEITRTRSPRQVQVMLIDPCGTLQGAVGPDHLLHHVMSRQQTGAAVSELAAHLTARLPEPGISPTEFSAATSWTGTEVVVVIDDHDLVTAGAWQESGLHLLAPLLPQAHEVGLHVVVAQRAADAMRSRDPLVQGLGELSVPTLLLPGGEEASRRGQRAVEMVPGRAQLLTRGAPARTIQVGWVP